MFVCMSCFVTCKCKFFSDWQKIYDDEDEDDNVNSDYDDDDKDNDKDDDYDDNDDENDNNDDNKFDRVVYFDLKFFI